LRKSKQDFWDNCKDVEFENKGISNIEAFYLWALIGHFRSEVVFESEIYRGRSTEIIARACKYYGVDKHIAVDTSNLQEEYARKKLEPYDIEYVIMDSTERLQKENPTRPTFYFVDGPKSGEPLCRLVDQIMATNWKGVVFHDCKPGGTTRKTLKKYRKHCFNGVLRFLSPEDSCDLEDLNDPYWRWYTEQQKANPEKQRNRMPCIGVWI